MVSYLRIHDLVRSPHLWTYSLQVLCRLDLSPEHIDNNLSGKSTVPKMKDQCMQYQYSFCCYWKCIYCFLWEDPNLISRWSWGHQTLSRNYYGAVTYLSSFFACLTKGMNQLLTFLIICWVLIWFYTWVWNKIIGGNNFNRNKDHYLRL